MSSKEDRELEEVSEKIHRLHLERWRSYDKEKELWEELIDIKRRRNAARRQNALSVKSEDTCGAKRSGGPCVKTDRFGKELKIGDTVEFLTSGRLVGKIWTIYKITDKRVLCERHNGVHKTHREFKNVKKLD